MNDLIEYFRRTLADLTKLVLHNNFPQVHFIKYWELETLKKHSENTLKKRFLLFIIIMLLMNL